MSTAWKVVLGPSCVGVGAPSEKHTRTGLQLCTTFPFFLARPVDTKTVFNSSSLEGHLSCSKEFALCRSLAPTQSNQAELARRTSSPSPLLFPPPPLHHHHLPLFHPSCQTPTRCRPEFAFTRLAPLANQSRARQARLLSIAPLAAHVSRAERAPRSSFPLTKWRPPIASAHCE